MTTARPGWIVVLSVGAVMAAGAALAADGGASGKPDEAHGKQIVMNGVGQNVPACASCHGETGIADGSGAFPRLTGQLPFYLYQQLRGFADGTRPNPVMSPIAKGLSNQDMQDVAAYYAAQQGPYFPQPLVDQQALELGGRIAAIGNAPAAVPACTSCHGPSGKGSGQLFPYLAGQYQSYLAAQLRDFRSGTRRDDPMAVMRTIAAKLQDGEITALAAYFASVRPPCQCETTTSAGAATAATSVAPTAYGGGNGGSGGKPSGNSTTNGAGSSGH